MCDGKKIIYQQGFKYSLRTLQRRPLLQPKASHRMTGLALLLISGAILLQASSQVQAQTARIVGLGATTCRGFNEDVKSNPAIRRDYLISPGRKDSRAAFC